MNNAPTNEFRPMGAWGYIGYQILFSIPLVGFILLLVFSFDNSYIARRNFARSYFVIILLAVIVMAILLPVLGLSLDALMQNYGV